ncbi:TPA: SDR family NAD(P)-dependent oxidoreductase [Legionella feeleii]
MSNKIILVTGASGFIGQELVKTLGQNGYEVRATVRSESALRSVSQLKKQLQLDELTIYNLGELTAETNWDKVIQGVDTIVHCAARAHILRETSDNPLETFRQINCQATEHLAKEANRLGVKRFIFISSIGVLGNTSHANPFNENSQPNPQVPYAQAKWEAEQRLKQLATNMELVIIRPPLVYGPGVKGNFEKLLNLVNKGLPLPFGKVKNRRQFIGVANLTDFIARCVEDAQAANQLFLVADREVVTTTQLLQQLSKAMGKKTVLLPIPHKVLEWGFRRIGKTKLADQLLNNLEINSDKAKTLLAWEPPYTMKEQLQQMVDYHKTIT